MVSDTGRFEHNELMRGNATSIIQVDLSKLPDLDHTCNCDDQVKRDLMFTMYMQLQSAVFSHACKKYLEAQKKLDSIINYNSNCCDC